MSAAFSMPRNGCESSPGREAQKTSTPTGEVEGSSATFKELLREYARFLEIDLLRADKTIRNHRSCLRNFQRFLKKNIASATKDDLRSFLQEIKPKFSSSTYANHVKAFRVFYRDFLGVGWSVNFKMPQPEFKPKWIPSEQELKRFCEALPSLKAKCMFLFHAATTTPPYSENI